MNSITAVQNFFKSLTCVDLSTLLENGIPRALTHPPFVINPTITHDHDGYYCQTIFMPEHIGTHVDAPSHMHPELKDDTIDVAQVDCLVGVAKVIDFSYLDAKPGQIVKFDEFIKVQNELKISIEEGDIVLFNFGYAKKFWSVKDWKFFGSNAPGLSKEIAEYLCLKKVKAIGTDTFAAGTPAVDGKESDCYIHKLALGSGIYLMECLMNLETLPGEVFFFAAPLKLKNGSGSPIRALAYY